MAGALGQVAPPRPRPGRQRQAARSAVGRLPGVRGVDNQVTLTDEPIATDVAERIEKALAGTQSHPQPLAGQSLQRRSRCCYLDGTTGSCAALAEAIDTTLVSPPGVNEVVNHIVVDA